MSSKTTPKFFLGTHLIGDTSRAPEPDMIQIDNATDTRAILDAFHARGYHDVDTGRNYPGSELRLGEAGAASDLHMTIHTKVADQYAGAHRADKIRESIDASLAELKTSSVETLYLHVPDRTTPFEESARAVNDAIKAGKAKHFGLSNYAPAEVQRFVEICEKKGLVKPSVYEGNYNAFTRQGEEELFPILRRHGIGFVAYSPAAGGILSGHRETSHRWGDKSPPARLYSSMYGNESIQAAVQMVKDAAVKHGVSGHAALLRWAAYHSVLDGTLGDGLVFGVSKLEQVGRSLDDLEAGPLPEELASVISSVKDMIKGHEPYFHL